MEETPIDNNPEASRWAELQLRFVSATALALLVLAVLWYGGFAFRLLVIVAGLLMIREWDTLTAQDTGGWKVLGLFYVAVPCASLIWLRGVRMDNDANAGLKLVLFVLFVVWATDIGAYFAGRKIGGPKLAPVISPSKTWAGLAGGVLSAAIIGGLSSWFTPYPQSALPCLLLGACLALIAQGGDLFESWLKRRAGAKDSGSLIPGHGGLLDRVDGLIFTLPLFSWLVFMTGFA